MRHLIAVTVLLLSKRFFPTTPLHPTRQPVDFGLSVRSPAVTTVAIAIACNAVATSAPVLWPALLRNHFIVTSNVAAAVVCQSLWHCRQLGP